MAESISPQRVLPDPVSAERADLSVFVNYHDDGIASMTLAVEGITCAACIDTIEKGLRALPGLVHARLNYTNHRLAVDWTDGALEPSDVIAALGRIGYNAHPFQPLRSEEDDARQTSFLLRCLGVAGFSAMNIMLLSVSVWSGNASDITPETRDLFHWLSALIAIPAASYAGRPFFQSAWRALKNRSLNMDVPISLGVLLALGMSLYETAHHAREAYFDSAITLLLFLLCGRYLDHMMRQRTRAVAGNLAALKGQAAHRVESNGELVTIPAQALRAGDRLLLRAGDRVPADVIVLTGQTEVDEALITGETTSRRCKAGDHLFAGSVNLTGAVMARVTAAGNGTLIDDVERLLEGAVACKSRYVRLADRAARLYAPVVHGTALLTLIGWLIAGASVHDAIVTAIAVLIITCPCALALAVPAVQVVAAGTLFKAGVLLNSGDALERLANVDVVMFDKTGTLTLPEPRVANAREIAPDLLQTASRLALSSRHPLAKAVACMAKARAPFDGVIEEPGHGVTAMIDGREARLGSPAYCGAEREAERSAGDSSSIIAFAWGGSSAILHVEQALRPDAAETVAALKARGLGVGILSGDRTEAVEPIARALGIADWSAALKPADKIAAIERIEAAGKRVLMVGDGLNDAPALACATVSLSPITATDLTQAQADAVFLGERLQPVLIAIKIAAKARSLMSQNLMFAIVYNLIAVPLAICGLVTPLIAALAMSGSSILVTVNALRGRLVRT